MYKKYNLILVLILGIFVIYNFIIWNLYTKELIRPPKGYRSGELSRLSYQKKYNILKKKVITLPDKHTEINNYNNQKFDVITIGDSFSNASAGGVNPYYQDYLVTNKGISVLNIPLKLNEQNKSVIDELIPILNNGLLDKMQPKYIILQTVERSVGTYLAKDFDFSVSEFKKNVTRPENVQIIKPSIFEFINNANFKFLLLKIGYLFSERPFKSSVYIKSLNKPLFGGEYPDKILFYDLDIDYMKYNSLERLEKVNENLNKIAKILNKKGINLIFIAVPDKYDLYYDYIKNNKLPKPTFFEEFKKLNKNYTYIDGKEILIKSLDNDVKDVYFQDDTHWSGIGVELLANELLPRL